MGHYKPRAIVRNMASAFVSMSDPLSGNTPVEVRLSISQSVLVTVMTPDYARRPSATTRIPVAVSSH